MSVSSVDEAKQLRSDTPPPPMRRFALHQTSWQRPMVAVTPPSFNTAQKVCGHAISALALPSSPSNRPGPHSHEGQRFIPTPLAIHREQVAAGGISRLSASPGVTGPLHREPIGPGERAASAWPLPKHHTPPVGAPASANIPTGVVQHSGSSAAPLEGVPAQAVCSQQAWQMPGVGAPPDGTLGGCPQRPPQLASTGPPGIPARRTAGRSNVGLITRTAAGGTPVWQAQG